MKKGLIIVNAYSTLKSATYQAERLKEEFSALGVEVEIRRNDFFPVTVCGDGKLAYKPVNCDFCVYLDKDKYVSEMLEKGGLRLFNRHEAIRICDDKMQTFIALAGSGIRVPETIPGLLCYDENARVSESTLDEVEEKLGYPVIVKKCYGSLGKEVFKADDRRALKDISEKVKCGEHLYQKFISSSYGRDMRVIVIGGKVFASMLRVSDGDFRSNLGVGGHGEKIALPEEAAKMCERAAEIIGLDYCGVDVLFGENGYLLCEVNSNAFFGGIESVTGLNVAGAYAKHIYKEIYG